MSPDAGGVFYLLPRLACASGWEAPPYTDFPRAIDYLIGREELSGAWGERAGFEEPASGARQVDGGRFRIRASRVEAAPDWVRAGAPEKSEARLDGLAFRVCRSGREVPDPNHSKAQARYARLLSLLGRHEEAMEQARRVEVLSP